MGAVSTGMRALSTGMRAFSTGMRALSTSRGRVERAAVHPGGDALAVEQLREASVPEREAGAGDHRQVEVLGSADDALLEHQPGLLGERLQHPRAYVGPAQRRTACRGLEEL